MQSYLTARALSLTLCILASSCTSSPPENTTKESPDNFLNGGCFELPVGETEDGSPPIACP